MTSKIKICASCNREIKGKPAISRKDNKTKTCSDCGETEAMIEWLSYREGTHPTQIAN